MPAPPRPDDPLEILRLRLETGVKVTPLCRAVIGWLANVPTDPFVAAVALRGERVALRLSDEPGLEPFGSLDDFLTQIAVVGRSLGLDAAQTSFLLTRARDLLE